jgi:hypothetical protein
VQVIDPDAPVIAAVGRMCRAHVGVAARHARSDARGHLLGA